MSNSVFAVRLNMKLDNYGHETLKIKYLVFNVDELHKDLPIFCRADLLSFKELGFYLCGMSFAKLNSSDQFKLNSSDLFISDLFDLKISAASTKNKLPYPEIFFRICLNFGCSPREVLVLPLNDDNSIKEATSSAGCFYNSSVFSLSSTLQVVDELNKVLEAEPIVTEWIQSTQVIVSLIDEEDSFLKNGFGYPGICVLFSIFIGSSSG